MLSHATALWWRGLIDRQPWPIEVSTPRRCRSLSGVNVHGRRDCRRVWHKRLPMTTIEQALLDFAARAPMERVRYALANRRLPEGARPPRAPGDRRSGTGRQRQAADRRSDATSRSSPAPAARSSGCSCRFASRTGSRCPMTSTCGSPASSSTRCGGSRRLVVELDGRRQPQLVGADPARPKQRDAPARRRLRCPSAMAAVQLEDEAELVARDLPSPPQVDCRVGLTRTSLTSTCAGCETAHITSARRRRPRAPTPGCRRTASRRSRARSA